MRISDWSSDVCSSDLTVLVIREPVRTGARITPPQEARVQAFIDRHPSWPAPLRLVCANVVGAVLCPITDFFARNGLRQASLILLFIAVYRMHEYAMGVMANRPEERRVGKECVSKCRSRGSRYLEKKKKTTIS